MRFKEFLPEDLTKDQMKKISRINNKLETDPDLIDEIWKDISLKAKDIEGQFVNRFVSMLDPSNTTPEKDQAFKDFLKKYAQIIAEIDAPTEEKFAFINSLGKKSHIDEKKLLSPGKSSWDSWLTGTEFSKKLFETAYNDPRVKTDNKGPGEAALAILSPNVTLAIGGAGDIEVNGTPVEVKAAAGDATSAGRLIPTKNTLGVYTAKQVAEMLFPNDSTKQSLVIEKYKNCSANAFGNFVQEFEISPEQIQKLLSNIFREESIQDKVAKVAKKGPQITGRDLLGLSIYNYARSQNDEHFLILVKANRTSLYFQVDQWEQAHGLQFSLTVFGNDTRAVGKTQVGILKSA
jgi:hypothetical protein